MVFDPQLGYDPEEWEECPLPDHFLAFSFPTRVVLSVAALLASIAFFWVLEARKTWVREDRRESILNLATPMVKEAVAQRRASVAPPGRSFWEGSSSASRRSVIATPLADLARTIEETEERERSRSSSSTRRRGSGRPRTPLTPDEKAKLQEWEKEVERVAESRLRATAEGLDRCEAQQQFSAAEENVVENVECRPSADILAEETPPSSKQSAQLNPLKEGPLRRLLSSPHHHRPGCVTPPSTPQAGVETGGTTVADLEERLAEMEALSSGLPQQPTPVGPAPESSIASADFEADVGWAEEGDEAAIKSPSSDSKPNLLLSRENDDNGEERMVELPLQTRDPPSGNGKGSRSSEEDGFIKVQNYSPNAPPEDVGAIGLAPHAPSTHSQPQRSIEECSDNAPSEPKVLGQDGGEEGDTITADEIEFVWRQQHKSVDGQQPPSPAVNRADGTGEVRVASRTESGSAASSISFPPSPLVVEEHENGYLVRQAASADGGAGFVQIPDSLDEIASHATILPTPTNGGDQQSGMAPSEGEERLISKLIDAYFDVPGEIQDALHVAAQSCAPSPVATGGVHQQPHQWGIIEVPLTIDTADDDGDGNARSSLARDKFPHSPYDMADDDGGGGGLVRPGNASAVIASHLEWVEPPQPTTTLTPTGAYIVEEEMLESSDIVDESGDGDSQRSPQHSKSRPDSSSKQSRARRRAEKRSRDEQKALMEEVVVKRDTLAAPTGSRGDGAASAEPTSRLVKTNEVFDRQEQLLFSDEAEDAVTYAPEIETEEIPPDEQFKLSQNSLNSDLVDNLDLDSERASPLGKTPAAATGAEAPAAIASDVRAKPPAAPSLYPASKILSSSCSSRDHLQRSPSPRLSSSRGRMGKRPSAPHFLRNAGFDTDSTPSTSLSMNVNNVMSSSLLNALGVSSTQEMLLKLTSLDALSDAMRKAGLESTNLIFGIDYTASNKYQGERSFNARSLHNVSDPTIENPYQQVIKIMGRTLAPFAAPDAGIPVFGFGDSTTGDWSVFPLNGPEAECRDLDEVLRVYNEVTPYVDLSGPTNFAPLIHKAVDICKIVQDYHILVIIADGQVTNERATRKAIVNACQCPLSIIVVGVGDGPWDMMRVFDESLPKRPWDNFHFVELNEIINEHTRDMDSAELSFAIHSLLEIPDQYSHVRRMGMVLSRRSTRQITPIEEGCGPDVNDMDDKVGDREGGIELETDV